MNGDNFVYILDYEVGLIFEIELTEIDKQLEAEELLDKYDMKLESSIRSNNFKGGRIYDIIAYKEFYQPLGKEINKSFGIWSNGKK